MGPQARPGSRHEKQEETMIRRAHEFQSLSYTVFVAGLPVREEKFRDSPSVVTLNEASQTRAPLGPCDLAALVSMMRRHDDQAQDRAEAVDETDRAIPAQAIDEKDRAPRAPETGEKDTGRPALGLVSSRSLDASRSPSRSHLRDVSREADVRRDAHDRSECSPRSVGSRQRDGRLSRVPRQVDSELEEVGRVVEAQNRVR